MSNPLVIPAGHAEVVFSLVSPGPKSPVSFSIGVAGIAGTAAVAATLGDWFSDTSTAGFRHYLDSNYQLRQVEVIGNTTTDIVAFTDAGSASEAIVPPSLALKVRKVTGARGKANKGYMFIPGIVDRSNVDEAGVVDPVFVAEFVLALAGLETAILIDGTGPCILHHANSSVTTPTPVSALQVQPNIAVQRRRMNTR